MRAAINCALANRQIITRRVRDAFERVFGPADMPLLYDVSHNTAQLESHPAGWGERTLLVHRKGATRSLGPGAAGLPDPYRDVGQPVIVGGSMEAGSWLLVGAPGARAAFATTAHGAGRAMSRSQAKKRFEGRRLRAEMERRGILVRAASLAGLAEEAGRAYKDIDAVVSVAERAGLSRRVARLVPLGCVKG